MVSGALEGSGEPNQFAPHSQFECLDTQPATKGRTGYLLKQKLLWAWAWGREGLKPVGCLEALSSMSVYGKQAQLDQNEHL